MYDEVIIYDTILNFFRFEKEIYLSLITRCHSRFLCGKFLFLDYVLFCHHKGFVLGLISSFSREKISMYFPLHFFLLKFTLKPSQKLSEYKFFDYLIEKSNKAQEKRINLCRSYIFSTLCFSIENSFLFCDIPIFPIRKN